MKNAEEVDNVGAVEGCHVEHEDDLDTLDVGHGQEVGQGPHQAPQQKEGRDENRQKLTASYEHIIYLSFNLEQNTLEKTAILDRSKTYCFSPLWNRIVIVFDDLKEPYFRKPHPH